MKGDARKADKGIYPYFSLPCVRVSKCFLGKAPVGL